MITEDIIDTWGRIKKTDKTIPEDILDFMKDSAIKELNKKAQPMTYAVWRNAQNLSYKEFVLWYKAKTDPDWKVEDHYILEFCEECFSMTNHLFGTCQKCKIDKEQEL